jgi:hypothetical protein
MEPLDPRRNVYQELEKFKQSGAGNEQLYSLVRQFINLQTRDADEMTRADNFRKTLKAGFALAPLPPLQQHVFDPDQFYVPLLPRSSSSSSSEEA